MLSTDLPGKPTEKARNVGEFAILKETGLLCACFCIKDHRASHMLGQLCSRSYMASSESTVVLKAAFTFVGSRIPRIQ